MGEGRRGGGERGRRGVEEGWRCGWRERGEGERRKRSRFQERKDGERERGKAGRRMKARKEEEKGMEIIGIERLKGDERRGIDLRRGRKGKEGDSISK